MDIVATVLDGAARGDALPPVALTFLLRQYRSTGRQDVCDVLGDALASALARHVDDRTTMARAGWLHAFTETAALSDDSRVDAAVRALIAALAEEWPSITIVDRAAISIDACLTASHLADPQALIPRAIDELERVVGGAYRPGAGVAHTIDAGSHRTGGLSDHVYSASALLTAYALTGRLPYSMLAEELMQNSIEHEDVVVSCGAARVLCRLAALHRDDEYRRAAVIRGGADYRAEAGRVLEGVAARLGESCEHAAAYGLALDEWRSGTA